MSKNMNKKNNSQITSIKNEEFDALLEARYGLKKEDLEAAKAAKAKKEKEQRYSWSKPSSSTVVEEKVEATPNTRRMSQGDKGFLGGLIAAAGIWLLSKAGGQSNPQQQAQPLTAEQEYDIVERRLMRDAYLRHISRQ